MTCFNIASQPVRLTYLSFWILQCLVTQAIPIDDAYSDHHGLRYLRSVGFEVIEHATVSEIDLTTGEQNRFDHEHLRRRRSAGENGDVHLNIRLDNNDEFMLKLRHTRSVLHPEATLLSTRDGEQVEMAKRDVNCFLTNQQGEQHAVLSYCRKTRGVFTHQGYQYAFVPVDEINDKNRVKRSESAHRVFVAKRKAESDGQDTEMAMDTFIELKRERRAITERPDQFEIETALVMDEDMVNYLKGLGFAEYDEWLDYMLLKWTGFIATGNAIWADKALIGYDVKITIKYINFWETNPEWYTSSPKIGATTRILCNRVKEENWPYDHVALQLGRPDGSPLGLSWIGGICSGMKRSGMKNKDCFAIRGPAHEIGHNLGLKHNDPSKGYCGPGDGGIMGYGHVGLSSCNRATLTSYISKTPKYDCLFEENVPTPEVNFHFNTTYSGQVVTTDELCETKYGPGYVNRPVDPQSCGNYYCTYLNQDAYYGIEVSSSPPPRGVWCNTRSMCIHKDCLPWESSGRDVQQVEAAVVVGGWSDYGDWSECSRTCGTGVRVARRTCNNPTPINSPPCEGLFFKSELCNTQPCNGDRSDPLEQIAIRADESCRQKKQDGLLSGEEYSGMGWWRPGGKEGDEYCLLACAKNEGGYGKEKLSLGLMPLGTPCRNIISEKGNSFRCVFYKCLEFGCDGIPISEGGAYIDSCGVCGGDGTSCEIITGSFTEPGSKGERLVVHTIPAGAREISFTYKDFGSQRKTFLELWSKDDVVAISHKLLKDKTTKDTPINYVGALWNYKYYDGLSTDGVINEPVVVKLHIYGSNLNQEITYRYSVPVAPCTGSCSNGGVWENCGCTCSSGFYGPTCESRCDTICRSGTSYDESTCTCQCGNRTYGDRCDCKHPFEGGNCELCKISACDNCGVFDESTCRCTCPDGYGGLTCSDVCEDISTDCDSLALNDGCNDPNVETVCLATCGLCTPHSDPPTPTC